MTSDDIEELKEKRICVDCVKEPYLRDLAVTENVKADCDYCDEHGFTVAIGDMAELVDAAFDEHYIRTAAEPSGLEYTMMNDPDSSYSWDREGEQVLYAIAGAAEIPEDAAQDIQTILEDQYGDYEAAKMGEETEYSEDSYYERKAVNSGNWQDEWRSFENSMRKENRFFSPIAADYLGSLFGGVEKLRQRDGSSVLVDAGPDTELPVLFRARVFQSEGKLIEALQNLDRELGPPPAPAALAGRMNARGISVFYGATDAAVALAEIRPPVGSRVLTGRFEILRPLKLLDLSALSHVRVEGSIFDPAYGTALEKAAFLDSFSERITRPVMPDDEALDYVITQAIADFLATDKDNPLDGLIYRSAQAPDGGVNVVLFHKAARVEPLDRPKDTEVESSGGMYDEDGWQIDYKVIERVPKPAPAKKPRPHEGLRGFIASWPSNTSDWDDRDATLRIDQDSVKVEYVKAVTFATDTDRVAVYRWEKRDPDDMI